MDQRDPSTRSFSSFFSVSSHPDRWIIGPREKTGENLALDVTSANQSIALRGRFNDLRTTWKRSIVYTHNRKNKNNWKNAERANTQPPAWGTWHRLTSSICACDSSADGKGDGKKNALKAGQICIDASADFISLSGFCCCSRNVICALSVTWKVRRTQRKNEALFPFRFDSRRAIVCWLFHHRR